MSSKPYPHLFVVPIASEIVDFSHILGIACPELRPIIYSASFMSLLPFICDSKLRAEQWHELIEIFESELMLLFIYKKLQNF